MSKAPSALGSTLSVYDQLIASLPNVERKGASMPYTSLNGHMFSFITKEGMLALRLPAEDRGAFLKKYKSRLCEQHGAVLEEYVEVPPALLKKPAELQDYFVRSHAYVKSLKPKPARKKKAK